MLTGREIRKARRLLGWDRPQLGRTALLAHALITAAESSDGPAWLTDEQEANIRRAFNDAGIRFEIDVDGWSTAVRSKVEP